MQNLKYKKEANDGCIPQNYRTAPCKNFHSHLGCTRGIRCHFLHVEKYKGVEIPHEEYSSYVPVQANRPKIPVPCRNFHSQKGCNYYEKCSFIHDHEFKGVKLPSERQT